MQLSAVIEECVLGTEMSPCLNISSPDLFLFLSLSVTLLILSYTMSTNWSNSVILIARL
jgi:hypothetical protein